VSRRACRAARAIIPEQVCDVWVAPLEVFAPHQRRLHALLTAAERAQVQRYRREHDRVRASLSRSLLRLLLARYLRLEPHGIGLDRRCPACGHPHGKPRLRDVPGPKFSVAHAGGLLVFAFHGTAPVGVDVEPLGSDPPAELVEMTLSPAERRQLHRAPARDRGRVFLRYWTGKEAVLKQLGTGLSVPLRHVTVDPSGPVRKAEWAGGEVWVSVLPLGEAHVGAIATAREVAELRIAQVPVA
jgi:4'-phosphopantetheinyl transferase